MKRTFKRAAAFILALAMVLSIPLPALANLQTQVASLGINGKATPTTPNTYTVSLTWYRPEISEKPDNSAVEEDRREAHGYDKISYRFEYRRVSANASETFRPVPGMADYKPPVNDPGPYTREVQGLDLEHSSIYEFRVVPVHKHTYIDGYTSTGEQIRVERDAPLDTSTPEQRGWFFTDYTVDSVTTTGREITVAWTVPTYGGKDMFDRYNIYWEMVPLDVKMELSASHRREVSTEGLGRTSTPGRIKYTYTFTATENEFIMGRPYSMRIEPAVSTGAGINAWRSVDGIRNNITGVVQTVRPLNMPPNTNLLSYSWTSTDIDRREYRAGETFRLEIPIYVTEDSGDWLRVYWDLQYVQGTTIEVYRYKPGSATEELIGTLGSAATSSINYWLTKDEGPMVYFIRLVTSADERFESEHEYYDPAAVEFKPYNPNILSADLSESGSSWNITWEAFVRDYYHNDETDGLIGEGPFKGQFIDSGVEYELWITDDVSAFVEGVHVNSLYTYRPGTGNDSRAVWNEDFEKWTYGRAFSQYHTRQSVEPLTITDNKLYYIKIVATLRGESSEPAYYSFWVPSEGVVTDPLMMSKPPLKLDAVKEKEIGISWVTQWYEVYNDHSGPYANTNQPEGWYSSFGHDGTNYVYGKPASPGKIYDLSSADLKGGTQDEAFARIDDYAPSPDGNDSLKGTLPKRFIDITGAGYEIYVAKYDSVIGTNGDADAAARAYLESINTGVPWKRIVTPPSNETAYTYAITESLEVGAIEANTAYVVFFRPTSEAAVACYPTYLTATTSKDPGAIKVTPTTPMLKIDKDMTDSGGITVYWELSEELGYELVYSDSAEQYPAGGTTISYALIQENGTKEQKDGKLSWVYAINGLFPNTEYFFWIRSTAGTAPPSEWSNPVSETTKDFDAPSPPRGLGIASQDMVDAYNKERATEFKAIASDYMILQWMRDYYDDGTETTSSAVGSVERIDVPAFLASSYMAKFNNLVANRIYYIRAKTILTKLRSGGGIKQQYSYCIQLSETNDFVDVVEIYIPALDPVPANEKDIIRKESAWTSVMSVRTLTSPDEIDGQWDERLYPLPQSDFEITFNTSTGELKYRFRSTGVAADGTHDNGVDQRFISRMIQERVYTYELDMSKYNGYTIRKRTLEVPRSIVSAMDERKVSLRLIADNMTFTVAPGSFKTAEVSALKDFAAAATAIGISIEQQPANAPWLLTGEAYASLPQALSFTVHTPTTRLVPTHLAADVRVAVKLNNRYTTYNQNVNTYAGVQDAWSPVKSAYDNAKGTMTFVTRRPGVYSAIAKALPSATDGNTAYTLLTRLDIPDLRTYNPNQAINASQFNNIVAAIARNKKSVAIYEDMSAEDYQSLGKSGILVSGSEVSREAGIHAILRLYELKTKATVKNFGTAASSPYTDIKNARQEYQASLLKAAKLGFFSGSAASPQSSLSMKDAFEMFEIVIDDAGL